MMKTAISIGIAISSLLLSTIASARGECLGNVCLGQELESVTVSWVPVQSLGPGKKVQKVLPDVQQAINRVFPKAADRQRSVIAKNISTDGIGFWFDNTVLSEVSKIAPVCRLLYGFGLYRSASGHETLVVFRPDNAETPISKWRISEIERIWHTSDEEHEMLRKKLETDLGPLDSESESSISLEHSMGISKLNLRRDGDPTRWNLEYASERSAEFLSSPHCGGGPSIE